MEHRVMGKTGMKVSVLGFGGAEIGFEKAEQETVAALLGAALDAGLNVIDTAECYGGTSGHPSSEELIGKAIAHRRDDFYLFTKCGHASGFEAPDWDIKMLEQTIDRSLTRLQTDHIDLIQLHGASEEMLRQGDVIAVLQRAKAAGKTRFIGYSGDNTTALYAVESGAFDTLQTSINIADQLVLEMALPAAHRAEMGVIAKRPIANVAWRWGNEKPSNGYHIAYWERLQKLAYPFLNGEDAVATALRFTLSQPGVHTAIVGTKNPERWQANAALLAKGMMSEAEIATIRDHWKSVRGDDWVGQG